MRHIIPCPIRLSWHPSAASAPLVSAGWFHSQEGAPSERPCCSEMYGVAASSASSITKAISEHGSTAEAASKAEGEEIPPGTV